MSSLAKMRQIISRGALLSRKISQPSQMRNMSDAAWRYRLPPEKAPKSHEQLAYVFQGIAWWWFLWHCITEPGHIFGEFEYPDPSKWTNEELGIPSV